MMELDFEHLLERNLAAFKRHVLPVFVKKQSDSSGTSRRNGNADLDVDAVNKLKIQLKKLKVEQNAMVELVPLNAISKSGNIEKRDRVVALCGILSFSTKDWGTVYIVDQSIPEPGIPVVVRANPYTCPNPTNNEFSNMDTICICGNIILTTKWRMVSNFVRAKTCCLPISCEQPSVMLPENDVKLSMASVRIAGQPNKSKDTSLSGLNWKDWPYKKDSLQLARYCQSQPGYVEISSLHVLSNEKKYFINSKMEVEMEMEQIRVRTADDMRKLVQILKNKNEKCTAISIIGKVSAVSPLIPASNGKHCLLEVDISKSSRDATHLVYIILLEVCSGVGLNAQSFIHCGKTYEFCHLRQSTIEFQTFLEKEERLVFSTTTNSNIHETISVGNSDAPTELGQVYERGRYITYEGVITARIGECVFELDGFNVENRDNLEQIRLFCTHWPCPNAGRGLREGVRIRVFNVIPMYATTFPQIQNHYSNIVEDVIDVNENYVATNRCLSGLVLTFRSQLDILDFSSSRRIPNIRVPNHGHAWSRNMARNYHACTIFWLLDTFSRFRFGKKEFQVVIDALARFNTCENDKDTLNLNRNFHIEFFEAGTDGILCPFCIERYPECNKYNGGVMQKPYVITVLEVLELIRSFFVCRMKKDDADCWTCEVSVGDLFHTEQIEYQKSEVLFMGQIRSSTCTGQLCLIDNTGCIEIYADEEIIDSLWQVDKCCCSWFLLKNCKVVFESIGNSKDQQSHDHHHALFDDTKTKQIFSWPSSLCKGRKGELSCRFYLKCSGPDDIERAFELEKSDQKTLKPVSTKRLKVLTKGNVRAYFNKLRQMVQFQSSLKVINDRGVIENILIDNSDFPPSFSRLIEGKSYQLTPNDDVTMKGKGCTLWTKNTVITPDENPLNDYPISDISSNYEIYKVSELLEMAFKVKKSVPAGNGRPFSKKPLLERECSFSGIIQAVGLRRQSNYELKFVHVHEAALWNSGLRFPLVTQFCVLFFRVRDLNTPQTIDVYVNVDKRLLPPGLCCVGSRVTFHGCHLTKSQRCKVFVQCKNQCNLSVIAAQPYEYVKVAFASRILHLLDFSTNKDLVSGYVMASIVCINHVQIQWFCKRCFAPFGSASDYDERYSSLWSNPCNGDVRALRCQNSMCESTDRICYAKLSCVIDDGTSKGQLLVEGEHSFPLFGIDSDDKMKWVEHETLRCGKLEYSLKRPSYGQVVRGNDAPVQKLAQFIQRSLSPEPWVIYVERGRDSFVFEKKNKRTGGKRGRKMTSGTNGLYNSSNEESESEVDYPTTYIPVGEGFQRTLKLNNISLRGIQFERPSCENQIISCLHELL